MESKVDKTKTCSMQTGLVPTDKVYHTTMHKQKSDKIICETQKVNRHYPQLAHQKS